MSKLQLIPTNFEGEQTCSYKIRSSIKGIEVTLTLLMTFNGIELEAGQIHSDEFLNDGETLQENLEYVFKEAETNWGLKLTEAILKSA